GAWVAPGAARKALARRRLLPAGALPPGPGRPATMPAPGPPPYGFFRAHALLTFGFFGADAFVTLLVVTVRHHSPVLAGLVLTAATLTWTAGAWIQARSSDRWPGRNLVRVGIVIILVGIA